MLKKIIALAIAAGFASASFAQATPAVPATPAVAAKPAAAAAGAVEKKVEAVKAEVWPAYHDWQERAAIMEHDGGLSREDAERAAYECLEAQHAHAA